jgi:predicted thioesterase
VFESQVESGQSTFLVLDHNPTTNLFLMYVLDHGRVNVGPPVETSHNQSQPVGTLIVHILPNI